MNENNAIKYIKNASSVPSPRIPEHTRQLLRALGDPSRKMKIIKVYGEVGKSILISRLSRMIAEAGYTVGLISLTHTEAVTREAILVNGEPITGQLFTHSVNQTAEALEASPFTDVSPTSEEILLATGLLSLEAMGCNILILEIPSTPHSATTALEQPLVNVVTTIEEPSAASIVCPLLDKSSEETVSVIQPPNIARMLTERCAQVNSRLTFPIKGNYYQMECALGRIRFFYNKKEYVLSSGALYEIDAALALIETYEALSRRGLRLIPQGLTKALLASADRGHFSIFSVSPTILLDCATTPVRFAALKQTLDLHRNILGDEFEVWTNHAGYQTISRCIEDENAIGFPSILVIDEKNPYKAIKLALRDRNTETPLLILGNHEFITYVDRTLKGFL